MVLLGLIIGAISGGIYGLLRKLLFSNTWLSGILLGFLVFIAILVLPIEGKGAARGFPDLKVMIYLIFGVLHLAFGVVLALLFERFTQK